MRTQKINFLLAVLLLLPIGLLKAQESENQAFYVHEDQVKPSMTQEYEKISKEFAELSKKHKLQDVSWVVAATTSRYISVSPMKNFAELDNNYMTPLAEKMGKEAFRDIFKRYNSCYDVHRDYVVYLNNELTYMPDGVSTEDQNYRIYHRMNVTPSNIQNLKGKLKELRALFEKKGSKEYFQIYHSGFGTKNDFYTAVIAAKDAQDYAKKSSENEVLLGEEGEKLFAEMFKYVSKYEVETGGMRPELAYSPEK